MTVDSIFQDALAKFKYASDEATWGKEEWWATYEQLSVELVSTGHIVGDCDDFAGYCVHLCRAAGIEARFALCYDELNECHCVCIAEDTWLLDNRQPTVLPWTAVDYRWISASGTEPGQPWRSIEAGVIHG